jgi:hypothetical protein
MKVAVAMVHFIGPKKLVSGEPQRTKLPNGHITGGRSVVKCMDILLIAYHKVANPLQNTANAAHMAAGQAVHSSDSKVEHEHESLRLQAFLH